MFKTLILFLALAFTAPAVMAAPEFDTPTCETQTMKTFKDTTIDACAQAAHEANRAYCSALGDTSQLPWEQAPEWQRESCRVGVRGVLIDGNKPEQRAKDSVFVSTVLVVSTALEPVPVGEDVIEPQLVKVVYGQTGYEAYAQSTGGKTFDGRDMPRWQDLPERIQRAWNDAAVAIRGVA